ncbi:extracellular solute-binding protein [Ruegeria sp.]|uniref:ABC transporter substrate-binding protein n=1 Tax=Ruegeria sp. TaxID=1879320 RepID=UPI00231CC853|nr:extracellular solute-binding protein [Ruegeria sp.]MDA7965368.1 extracellular solute-binding protein [Ruegeria sp.]
MKRFNMNRRAFLTASSAAVLATPSILRAQDRSLKVSAFGGYFEDSLIKHVYPKFTEDTGIAINSVSQSGGASWWAAIRAGAATGEPPADVSMPGGQGAIRQMDLFAALDEAALPNIANVDPALITRDAEGRIRAVAVLAWYTTFVTNTDVFPEPPASWADMWGETYKGSLGLNANADTSYILDITAKTFFDGQDILRTREGLDQVMEKAAELRENVTLWYKDEGQFQQALQSGEIPAGQYYHDVTLLAAADGFPVRSTFPAEGGVIDFGSWGVIEGSQKLAEAEVFVNWCCSPEVQALMSRMIGTAPIVPQALTDLTDEEFGAVSAPGAPIVPLFDVYVSEADYIAERWASLIAN